MIDRLGWTLLHFLWQGAVIAALYVFARSLLSRRLSAEGRYLLACAALISMVLAPPLTFLLFQGPAVSGGVWSVPVSTWQRLLPAVVAVWFAGVLMFSLRLFGAWRFTRRLRALSVPAPIEWRQAVERIALQLGATRPVRLMLSSLVNVPSVIGWLRPVILLPVEALSGMPAGHITALLGHELAHIRRHDYLASLMQSLAEALLFYHPAVWWISEQIRCERELCCDELAAAVCADVLTYAQALAALESLQHARLELAVAADSGSLVNRIRRLLEPASAIVNTLPGPGAAWAMTLLCFAGAGTVAMHAAQSPPPLITAAHVAPVPGPSPFVLMPPPATPAVAITALAAHTRRGLLFDPLLPAQVASQTDSQNTNIREVWRKWLSEDVAYIISDVERRAFRQFATDEERENFVEQFWLKRDPTPGTAENEYKEEHYRRIEYANLHFSTAIPGWKTDRGRIYIQYGPPDEIDTNAAAGRPWRVEAWRYRFIEGIGSNVRMEFEDTAGTGDLRMPGSPLAGMLANPSLALPAAVPAQSSVLMPSVTNSLLPLVAQIDYERVTDSSTMVRITIQFRNRDLQLQSGRAQVNIFGRILTMNQRPVHTFETPLSVFVAPDQATAFAQANSVWQQAVPLPPGAYRLHVVAQDRASGNMGSYEVVLDVPQFEEGKLAATSLMLADSMEPRPAKTLADAFTIADMRIRPRLGNQFALSERMGVFFEVYNLLPGPGGKPSGSIDYEIDRADSSGKILSFSDDIAKIDHASASQVTIRRRLPLSTIGPGAYVLKVKVTDVQGNQTLQRETAFTVTN